MKQPTGKAGRGGARVGSGRKRKIIDPVIRKAYVDQATVEILENLAGGNYSEGSRIAAQVVSILLSNMNAIKGGRVSPLIEIEKIISQAGAERAVEGQLKARFGESIKSSNE
jgi:hypothetical protein